MSNWLSDAGAYDAVLSSALPDLLSLRHDNAYILDQVPALFLFISVCDSVPLPLVPVTSQRKIQIY